MMRKTASVWLAAVTMVTLAACGSCSSSSNKSSGGGDGGGVGDTGAAEAGTTAAQACADFATAFCGRLEACTPFAVSLAYGDSVTCAQRLALACMPQLSLNGTKATPDDMEACAQAIGAQTCDEALDNAQPSACNVPGALATGAVCGSSAQCSTGFCKAGSMGCGTCAARPGAGASCVADTDCQATLVCSFGASGDGGVSGTCVGPAAAGASCSATQPCLRSLACVGGTCKAPVATGGACTAQSDCDAAHGGYCNTQSKVCAQTGLASMGQACGIVGNNVIACSSAGTCGNFSGTQGTCHQPAADGAACGPGIGCMSPAICTSTARCTVLDPGMCH